MSRFPHLAANGNESEFPNIDNIRTYKYDNSLDYSRFDNVQMNITLCKVPWDMGEAHVGNRTISGIGNVVYFGDKATRDKWFDSIPDDECYRFATKYKELHRDNSIVVPIPFDVAARYNYIAVSYEPFASSGDLLEYEETGGLDNWYWFVREVEFLAPNSTRLHLLNDAWQTFIYDMDIPYMMLERGHAPMSKTSADRYLANPIRNCEYLLSPEQLQPDKPRIATSTHEHVFNTGNMYAVIITGASTTWNWGSKSGNDWHTPATNHNVQGVSSYDAFAVAASNFNTFINNANADIPQFIQTIQAVCFVSSDMVTLSNSYTFCGVTCYWVSSDYKTATVHTLAKSDFGYPTKYADIAKLYTYPYSMLVLTDQDGNETEIRIEDTNGKIQFNYCVSLVYPWLNVSGSITSVGKTPRRNISFSNINTRNMPIGGNWHELLMSWEIPTFAVTQAANVINDYATHFDRAQQAYAADNAQANANASADMITGNAAVTTAGNSAVTARSNTSAAQSHAATVLYNIGMAGAANAIIAANATSTIQANEQQATIAAASGAVSGAVNAIGSAATGNIAGAATGLVNGIVGAASTLASMNVGNALTAAQAANAQASNSNNSSYGNTKDDNDTTNQISTASDITDTNNSVTTAIASNTSATQKANAARDRATVTGAIGNQIAQAALGTPETFGDFGNGEFAVTRPLALFSNVLTQDDYTIAVCGDDMLRYGYEYNGNWTFDGNWCVMPRFTYWKLSDFWVKGLQVPDMYVDKIRFFLFGGVTVWANPDDIGNVSIYENV